MAVTGVIAAPTMVRGPQEDYALHYRFIRIHDHRTLYTKSRGTALMYDGVRMQGLPVGTFVRGRAVMRDGQVVGDAGWGQWIRPQ